MPNYAPTALKLSFSDPSGIQENAKGVRVGILRATDLDPGDSFTFSTIDRRFEIRGNELWLAPGIALDYEAGKTVQVQVTATDAGGLSLTQNVAVTVTDVNEAPSKLALRPGLVAENTPGGVVGLLTTADQDRNDSFTYAVSDTRFEVVGNTLKLRDGVALDYEAASTIQLQVTSTDAGGLSLKQAVAVTVTNVNEAPTKLALLSATVAENTPGGVVGLLTTVDQDRNDSFTYAVSDTRFEVVGATLKLRDGIALDYEAGKTVQVQVTATDAGGLSLTQNVAVTVTDVNEAPSKLALRPGLVAENTPGGVVGLLTTADQDRNDSFTYAVSDTRFEVVGNTLKLRDGVALDYEAAKAIQLQVTSTDADGLSLKQAVAVTVTNVNEAPTNLALTDLTFFRAGTEGATVGKLAVSDPDEGDSLSFSVSDNRFEVVSGLLKLKSGVALTDNAAVSLSVTATDLKGLQVSNTFSFAAETPVEQRLEVDRRGANGQNGAPGVENTAGGSGTASPDTNATINAGAATGSHFEDQFVAVATAISGTAGYGGDGAYTGWYGGNGGLGGAGGNAVAMVSDASIDFRAVNVGNYVINDQAIFVAGAYGGFGGHGGGVNGVGALPGSSGDGGDATAALQALTIATDAALVVLGASATGGYAGGWNKMIQSGNGVDGVAGANGGAALAEVNGATVAGWLRLEINVSASGGVGAPAGVPGYPAGSTTYTVALPNNQFEEHYIPGAATNGAAGGDGGDATARIKSLAVNGSEAADTIILSLSANGGDAGSGSAGMSAQTAYRVQSGNTTYVGHASPAGADGPDGQTGITLLEITDTKIRLGGGDDNLTLNLSAYDLDRDRLDGLDMNWHALSSTGDFQLRFEGNVFDGGAGFDTLVLGVTGDRGGFFGASATIDLKAGTISFGDGPTNGLTNFEGFMGTVQADRFIDGTGDHRYNLSASFVWNNAFYETNERDVVVFTPGHGQDIVGMHSGATHDVLQFNGFGAGFDSFAELLAATQDVQAGDVIIATPDGGNVTLVGLHETDLAADMFIFG
jgi:hypothetical protein